jgi:hypothetical protein
LQKVCGIDPVFDQELAEKVKISINVKR